MEHPGFGLSVVVRYVVLPSVVLGLITVWYLRRERPPSLEPARADQAMWWLIGAFAGVYVAMSALRYLAYRTTIQDLGVYDQRIWALSGVWPFPSPARIVATFGHFSPILALHVLAYKVYPSAVALLGLQIVAMGVGAYPLYQLARRWWPEGALVLAAGYLLYPSVVFTVLFDFHPDHLIVPLLLFAFYFLDARNFWGVAGAGLLMLLVKESLVPTVAAFGVYAILVTRRYLLGTVLAVGSAAFFWLVIMPRYPGLFAGAAAGGESYGYLGASLPEILKTFIVRPGVWLPEIAEVPKLKFLFLMLAPLMFLPLLAPGPWLVALPGLLMALLSRHPHRYQIWAQYVSPLIAPFFVAAMLGGRRLTAFLAGGASGRRRVAALLPWWIAGTALYFNVVFSPSPLSTAFWLGQPEWLRWPYHFQAYLVTDRDRQLRAALERHVPADPAVASQNNINSSQLARRAVYLQFPGPGAYVVVDTQRSMFVFDGIDPKLFLESVERLRRERPIVYESDGILIFGPSARLPAP